MENLVQSENQKISQELLKIDKRALQAYQGALRVLRESGNPDRFSQSAHSLREVTNIIVRKRSIPQEIAGKEEVLRQKIERRFVEKPELLPLPAEKNIKALIKKWADLHKFFLAVLHHGKEVSEDEFAAKLSEFEAILLEFLKLVPEAFKDLDSLLRVQSPSEEHIKRLSELLKHPSHVDYFFLKLDLPNWLGPLKEHGFFANPPKGITAGNYIMFPSWPLSKYLVRIASQRPKQVIELTKSIDGTENFRIHLDLIECALKMPPSFAKEIIPLARKWIANPYPNLMPEKLGELCIKLCEENELDSAIDLLQAILDVKGSDIESEVALKEAQPYYSLWEYDRILNNVATVVHKKRPCSVIEVLCNILLKSIKVVRPNALSVQDDRSYVWRPAIENHPQNREGRDVRDLLVNAIRNSLESLGEINEKTFLDCYALLQKFNYSIFRRIEIHLMRKFPKLLRSQINSVISKKETFDEISLWHEYYNLLHEQYSNLPQELKDKILKWIEEGSDLERFVAWYKKTKIGEPSQAEKDAHIAHWQIGYLSPIKDYVPPVWKEKWQELVTKYGKPEHPDFHIYMGPVIVGSKSPLTEEEIKKKTPQEVVNYLRTWEPSKEFFAPSREGLAHTLGKVISENPSSYTSLCQEFRELYSVYIYHLLSGFRIAIQKENTFDWKPVILFCEDLLISKEGKALTGEKMLYDWNSIYREIADLLEEGLKSKTTSPSIELRETIWALIEVLLKHNEPDLAFEDKYDEETLDPVFLSLNTVRGKAMHSAIQYALWCARCLNLSQKKDRMVPEVKEQLEAMLKPECEPTKTVRAVYGIYLPQLFYLNKDWVEEHISSIFPEDSKYRSLWNVAWEAYITYCGFYKEVYESIRNQYKIAIDKLSSPRISKVTKDHLSQHLLTAYLRELEDLKDNSLVSSFFKKAQPQTRGHAIWFIGRVLKDLQTSKIEERTKHKIIERIMNLWEWRIQEARIADSRGKERFAEELKWFGMWFIYSLFNKDWAISQLYGTLELTEGVLEFANGVVEKFHFYTKKHYLTVLKSITLLVKEESQRWMLVVSTNKIKELLAQIVNEHSHQQIKPSVNDLVNILAKKGYHEFADFFIK